MKLDAKLKLEQEKRAMLDVELRGLRAEEQEHAQSAVESHKEVRAKIGNILTLLGLASREISDSDVVGDIELVRSHIAELLAMMEKLREEKTHFWPILNNTRQRLMLLRVVQG